MRHTDHGGKINQTKEEYGPDAIAGFSQPDVPLRRTT